MWRELFCHLTRWQKMLVYSLILNNDFSIISSAQQVNLNQQKKSLGSTAVHELAVLFVWMRSMSERSFNCVILSKSVYLLISVCLLVLNYLYLTAEQRWNRVCIFPMYLSGLHRPENTLEDHFKNWIKEKIWNKFPVITSATTAFLEVIDMTEICCSGRVKNKSIVLVSSVCADCSSSPVQFEKKFACVRIHMCFLWVY